MMASTSATIGSGNDASNPKPRRKQRASCGACYLRRVKCDLRDVTARTPPGVQAICTNCSERHMTCVNEFAKSDKEKYEMSMRRKVPRVHTVEQSGGAGPSTPISSFPASSSFIPSPAIGISVPFQLTSLIPRLQMGFFASPFYRRFHTQRPIVEPKEFSTRYLDWMRGDVAALGPAGELIAKVFVTWAASYGVDEAGHESDDLATPALSNLQLIKSRRDRCNSMVLEMLDLVDKRGILRSSTWDGVRVLLLLLPLTEDCVAPLERQSLYQTTLNQLYILCHVGASIVPGSNTRTNHHAIARIFWYTHVHEGITSGIRGRKLVFDEDDLRSFHESLPSATSLHYQSGRGDPGLALVNTILTNSYTYRFALTPIRISTACRMINVALTGPKARKSGVDEHKLKGAWEMLASCWDEFEELRNLPPGGILTEADTERYINAWQIFIFECHNIVLETLKVKSVEANETMQTTLNHTLHGYASDNHHPHAARVAGATINRLLALAEANCRFLFPVVIRLIERGLLEQDLAFFQYDAGLCRDGVLFAGSWATDDLQRDLCTKALSLMRWGYSFSDIRVDLIKFASHANRRNRGSSNNQPHQSGISTVPTYGMPFSGPFELDIPSMPAPGFEDQIQAAQWATTIPPNLDYSLFFNHRAHDNGGMTSFVPSYSQTAPSNFSYLSGGPKMEGSSMHPHLNSIGPFASEASGSGPGITDFPRDPLSSAGDLNRLMKSFMDKEPDRNDPMAETVASIIRPYTPALYPDAAAPVETLV